MKMRQAQMLRGSPNPWATSTKPVYVIFKSVKEIQFHNIIVCHAILSVPLSESISNYSQFRLMRSLHLLNFIGSKCHNVLNLLLVGSRVSMMD